MDRSSLDPILRELRLALVPAWDDGASDARLLGQFLDQRDPTAFQAILARHAGMVWGVCRRVLSDPHDAEDAFQVTFLALLRKAGRINRRQALAGWLYQVAYRTALRCRSRRRPTLPLPEDTPLLGRDATLESDWRELRPILDQELMHLPERYRMPVVLCYLEGKPYAQAAREIGCPKGTLSIRLARARNLLRRRLTRRGVGLSAALVSSALGAQAAEAAPAALLAVIRRAGLDVAAGATEKVAPRVLRLVEEVTRPLLGAKLKVVVAAAVVVGLAALGTAGGARFVLSALGILPAATAEPIAPLPFVPGEVRVTQQTGTVPAADGIPNPEVASVAAEQVAPRVPDRYGDPLPRGAVARLGTVRLRLGGEPRLMVFSPDGKYLATLRETGPKVESDPSCPAVALWEVATGRRAATFVGHAGPTLALAFSPDGRRAATGGADRTVRLWDTETGEELRRLEAHTGKVTALAFAPRGDRLASAGDDGLVCVWDAAGPALHGKFEAHRGGVCAVAFTVDGKGLLTAGTNSDRLRLWDLAGPRLRREYEGGVPGVCELSAAEDRLCAATTSGVIWWDIETGARQSFGHEKGSAGSHVVAAGLTRDGTRLAVCTVVRNRGGAIDLHDLTAGGKRVRQLALFWPGVDNRQRVTKFAFAPGGKLLAMHWVGSHTVTFLDPSTSRPYEPVGGHSGTIHSVAFAPDGKSLLTVGGDGTARTWNARSGEELRRLAAGRPATAAAFTSRGLLYPDSAGGLWFDSGTPADRRELGLGLSCLDAAVSADGRTAILQRGPEELEIWDTGASKSLGYTESPGCQPAVSADGSLIAGVKHPRGKIEAQLRPPPFVRLWNRAGQQLWQLEFQGHVGALRPAFSPDGTRLAVPEVALRVTSSKYDPWEPISTRVLVFEIGWGEPSAPLAEENPLLGPAVGPPPLIVRPYGVLSGHPGLMVAIAFAPDGRTLASAGEDGSVRQWEVTTGKECGRFVGHAGQVNALAFSPDGKRLATASRDTTALLWDVWGDTRPAGLSAKQAQECWEDLAADDASQARRAMRLLVRNSAAATQLFKRRLRPVDPDQAKRIGRWVRDLDSNEFAVRQRASDELERAGEFAEPALRKALDAQPPLEVRRRVEALLKRLAGRELPTDVVQALRAVEVLEAVNTSEADRMLRMLADGAADARLTREAVDAVRRRETRPMRQH